MYNEDSNAQSIQIETARIETHNLVYQGTDIYATDQDMQLMLQFTPDKCNQ